MDETNAKLFTAALGKDIARVVILNTAATIGLFAGMIAIGALIDQAQKIKPKKSKNLLVK